MKHLFILCLSIFVCQKSLACKPAPDSDWFLSEGAIIRKATHIFLVEVTTEAGMSEASDYTAKIIKILKANSGPQPPKAIQLTGFANSKVEFKRDNSKGRAVYRSDCRLWTNFEVGSEYILLMKYHSGKFQPLFHARALEYFTGEPDPWYKKILGR